MPTSTNIDGNLVIGAAVGAFMGVVWFIKGFKELKIKRTIQNIPTSKINTGAVGTDVEIKGNVVVEKERIVNAPISGKLCVLYHIEIQVERRRKNSTYWATVDQYYSHKSFYVDDQSGASALVQIEGAEVKRKGKREKYYFSSSEIDSLPGPIKKSITDNRHKIKSFKLKKTSWLLSAKYRILEWHFEPNEKVYVLGHAESGLRLEKLKKPKMKLYLKAKKAIQQDEKLQARFDTNRDGTLDHGELERGTQVLAQRMSDKQIQQKETTIPNAKLIFKKKKPHPFIISNRPERELIQHMGNLSILKIWGGPILTVACIWYLFTTLSNFGLF